MDIIQAVVLGILQGVFEWLPVSSQGQVAAIAMAVFSIEAQKAIEYAIFLHIGTLFAAVVYFRKELAEILRGKEKKARNFIAIAVAATVITAVPSYVFLKSLEASALALMLLIAVMLFATGIIQRVKKKETEPSLGKKNSLLLGLVQGFAVLPGVSRSGITTSALLFEGFSPEKAFRISFLLSVPSVLLGEMGLGIVEGFSFEPNMLIALAFAFAFGLASIDLLIRAARRIDFSWFCFGFGALYLALAMLLL